MVGCFVPKCKSGHGGQKAHMFRAPKDVSEEWIRILNKLRADKTFNPLNPSHALCELHFDSSVIIGTWDHEINGKPYQIQRKNWTLRPGSLPTIFPDIPKHLHPHVPKPRRPIKRKCLSQDAVNLKRSNINCTPTDETENPTTNFFETISLWHNTTAEKFKWSLYRNNETWSIILLGYEGSEIKILKSATFTRFSIARLSVGIHNITDKIMPDYKKPVIESAGDLMRVLELLSLWKECTGLSISTTEVNSSGEIKNGKLYSRSCELVGQRTVCFPCIRFHRSLQNRPVCRNKAITKPHATPHQKINKLAVRYKKQVQVLKASNRNLLCSVRKLEAKMKCANFDACYKFVQGLSLHRNQKEVILHTLKAIKIKSSTGNRYSSSWLLECLLLRIKSPAAYRHLRESKMLPLPHLSTLQRIIAHEKCQFGFSVSSFEAIRREYTNLARRDRQGTLVFDELKLRESLDYSKQTHRMHGFIDLGDENSRIISEDKDKFANHALVMMYRPLNANWVQPIGAFATRDAAKGEILAKLVLQAIVKLESMGAEVVTVVCDGAKPNRKMWKCFGISGKLDKCCNKISHPCDDSRELFFSSDVPHLYKCIRNHFLKYINIQFQGKTARFSHYEKLYSYENTLAPGLRHCPKLTQSHVYPNNFEKMVVPLATQLFSRHVGTGLTFYKNEGVADFQDACGTIALTYMLNDSFDALNTKFPKQGIVPGSANFKVLQDFLSVVICEQQQRDKNGSYVAFASDETLEGLRVTLSTTLEVIEFLVKDLKFHYVLTVKFNQDTLEKFFGLIRAAGGREEHPTIKNFLHLYRLLSMYNPCKRVIRGNIGVNDGEHDETVLCNFRCSLKKTAAILEAEQRKINDQINSEILQHMNDSNVDGNMAHLADHNYTVTLTPGFAREDWDNSTGTINKKIVFHLCGYVAYKFHKISKCRDCVRTLYQPDRSNCDIEYASLTDLLNKGPLHYPSGCLFRFVAEALEPAICKVIHATSFFGDMLIETMKYLPSVTISELGCSVKGHREDLLCQLIPFYMSMRFNFWCRTQKDKIGKGKRTRAKRKESKLV